MNWIQALGARMLGLEVKAGPSSGPVFVGARQDGKPVTTEWDAEKAVTEGLKANTWVYAAVSKVATGFASVPLVLEQLKGDAWTPDPAHEIQALLDHPNDHMARQDVMERWAYHMLLTGNALWLKTIAGGKVIEVWPVLPQQIKPIPSRADFLKGYEYKPTPQDKITKKPEEVAHWMFVDPNNPYWGLAPLQAAAAAVDTDMLAAGWQRQLLGKGGRPGLVVMLDSSLPLNRQKEAQAFINEQMGQGRSVSALVVGGATKAQPLSLNALELDYLNSRKFTREEVAAAFGVPPVLLSFGEAATFANLDAAKTALWEDRIVPLLEDYTQGLMSTLFPHWGLTQAGWRIRADLSGVRALQSNLRTQADVQQVKATTLKTLVEAGVPVNVARAFLDLDMPDIEGGDAPRPPTPQGQPPPASKAARRALQRKDKGDPVSPAAQLARRDEWEGEIRKKVASLLLEAGDTYASAYADGSLDQLDEAVDLSMDEWQALLEATHQAVIEAEGGIAYTAALKAISSSGGGGAFDVLDPAVTDWISGHTADAVKGITTTTRDALRGVVSTGVSNGDSVRDIAKAIKAQCITWSDTRATLVARTEVATAFGAAHQLSAQQIQDHLGVEMVKTWHATEDSRTRPEHAEMDGETVAIDAAFSNGLDYPSEPNCRCVVTFDQKGG